MQDARRSNRDRTQATRATLLQAARALFVEKGYADTSTPEIVVKAGMTRGALYHHFSDKRGLFRAVLEQDMQAMAAAIAAAVPATEDARTALMAGSDAYLQAMSVPGRTRLLLVEGPVVLGDAEMTALDDAHVARTLRDGLAAALPNEAEIVPILTGLLSSAFDRAALQINGGADPDQVAQAMRWLLQRVLGSK